jgi:hypothetical protein
MKKISILLGLFILALSFPIYCQEEIEINIDGKIFTRPYPQSLSEATELIDSLVEMYNDLGSSFLDYREIVRKEEEDLKGKIEILEQNNQAIKGELEQAEENIKIVESYIKKESARPKDWMLLAAIGPAIDVRERFFGLNFELGVLKSLHLFNSFAGLNINTNIYYEQTAFRVRGVGLSLYFGIFLE